MGCVGCRWPRTMARRAGGQTCRQGCPAGIAAEFYTKLLHSRAIAAGSAQNGRDPALGRAQRDAVPAASDGAHEWAGRTNIAKDPERSAKERQDANVQGISLWPAVARGRQARGSLPNKQVRDTRRLPRSAWPNGALHESSPHPWGGDRRGQDLPMRIQPGSGHNVETAAGQGLRQGQRCTDHAAVIAPKRRDEARARFA